MNYTVYYQRFFGLLRPKEVRSDSLRFSHRCLGQFSATGLDDLYRHLQGEQWSPHGEARVLIERLHLHHTSMSVGDVVQDYQGLTWVCNDLGWLLLHPGPQPVAEYPKLWLTTEVDDQKNITRIKISDERDCLPPDAASVEAFGWTAFETMVSLARLMEQRFGWQVCIDLGDLFYETDEERSVWNDGSFSS